MALELGRWISFLSMDDETIATLRDFAPVVEPHMDGIMDVFYERITSSQAAAALFAAPYSMGHARQAQKKHWLTFVLAGRFDDDYLAAAQNIGRTHYHVGVDLMFYTGAYSVVLDALVSLITDLYQDRPDQQRRVLHAVNRAVFLDMGLAVSTYYGSIVGALEDMSNELNFSLARAGEFRDNETGAHLMRMSRMCQALALAIGKDQKWAQMILVASPLHDVGKIGIPDDILLKPGRLGIDELEVMRRHPTIGGEIIPDNTAEVIRMAKRISLTHHERWDGVGYPAGLKGEEIPLEGRIAAICDVYDALLSARPYKEPWPQERVVAHMLENRGQHFDPELVAAFLKNLPEMDAIRARYHEEQDDGHSLSA